VGWAVAEPEAPSSASATTTAHPRRLGLVLATATVVVVLDQLTKTWAVHRLSAGRIIDLVGSLRLNLAFNQGAAFSVGDGWNVGPWIAVLALVVVSTLVFTGPTARSRVGAVAIGLVAGGALGNLLDRAFRAGSGFMGGRVVDWIDVQWWPVFNVADSAVCIGAVALVIYSIRAPQEQ
jgi:signal peptidase II